MIDITTKIGHTADNENLIPVHSNTTAIEVVKTNRGELEVAIYTTIEILQLIYIVSGYFLSTFSP